MYMLMLSVGQEEQPQLHSLTLTAICSPRHDALRPSALNPQNPPEIINFKIPQTPKCPKLSSEFRAAHVAPSFHGEGFGYKAYRGLV